jgi:hypothetical protein
VPTRPLAGRIGSSSGALCSLERRMKQILLITSLLVLSIVPAVANDIDQTAIDHPMFDNRMENTPIKIQGGTSLYDWFESEKKVGQLRETVDGRIIGRYLFPSNYHNEEIIWWYYVNYTVKNKDNYYWIRDTDFVFRDNVILPGVYSFNWIPENKIFYSLSGQDVKLLIRRDNSTNEYDLFLGSIKNAVFHAYCLAKSQEAHSPNYLKFVFLNCMILFPTVPYKVIPFIYVRNPYESLPNVPEIKLVQDAGQISKDELISGYGRVNDSYVRIRKSPDIQSTYYDERLMKNQIVEILEKTSTEVRIDEMLACWYKIRTQTGVVGWSYGWFIDEEVRYLMEP